MSKILKSLFRKKRKKESWLKYISYLVHLWFGLLSSVVVFVLCISGCLYAFKTQIIEAYNYDKVFITHSGTAQTPSELQQKLSLEGKELISLTIPESSSRSWNISYKDGSGAVSGSYYNPYSKKELGNGDQSLNRFFEVVLDLHRNLLLGNVGRQIGGISVLMFLVLMISGFFLWLPKKLKYLKQSLTVKLNARFQRINHDLHNVLGFYAMIFLMFIAITGIYVTYPWVKNALIVSLGGEQISQINTAVENVENDAFADLMADMMNRESEKTDLKNEQIASVQKIVDETNLHFPNHGTVSVEFPNDENPRFMVKKINSDNLLRALLPDELTFSKTGELKTKEIFLEKPLNKQFSSLAKPLHTGEIMGLPSIIFYFIISLIGAMLPITGIIIWLHRLKKLK